MSTLFFYAMKYRADVPRDPANDRFVMSKVKLCTELNSYYVSCYMVVSHVLLYLQYKSHTECDSSCLHGLKRFSWEQLLSMSYYPAFGGLFEKLCRVHAGHKISVDVNYKLIYCIICLLFTVICQFIFV